MTVLYKQVENSYYPWSQGSTSLVVDHEAFGRNLIISIKCCFTTDQNNTYYALFDTGAEWSVVPASLADKNSTSFIPLDIQISYHTRAGLISCELHSCDMTILVDDGAPISIRTTVAIVPDESGLPLVIGFKNFLSQIRWACDPTIDQQGRIYFGVDEI